MLAASLLIGLAACSSEAYVVDTNYTADDNAALINPERGMYYGKAPNYNEAGVSHSIVAQWLWLAPVCNMDLTWNGHNEAGTSAVLNEYASKLEQARDGGYKVLFRPRYDTPQGSQPNSCGLYHADTMERQRNHIDAVAAMLGDFRDAIAFIQAGYLGKWGEWNLEGGSSKVPLLTNTTDRNAIIDHVLAAYAANGILQHVEVRRPVFAKEVLSRDANARVGLHNDCFMSTGSDMGTYSNFEQVNQSNFGTSAEAKEWAQDTLTPNASFGGETCPVTDTSSPDYLNEQWRSCSNMVHNDDDPAALHMSYLNGDYAADGDPQGALGAVSSWKPPAGDCFDDIRRHLGYRFEVTKVRYTPTIEAGGWFGALVDVRNTGWARLHKPRQAKLVLRDGPTHETYNASTTRGDVAGWAPGQTETIGFLGRVPSIAGSYSVRLWIPDPDAPSRIPYAVKLASLRNGRSVFDSDTGENDLGVSITVE